MKKLLFLIAALTVLFALSCDSDNNMPCLTCILQEGEGYCGGFYTNFFGFSGPSCAKEDYDDCFKRNGTFYGSDSTCGGMLGYCSFDNSCIYGYAENCSGDGTFYGNDNTCGGNFGYCSFGNSCAYGSAKDCSDKNGTLYGSDNTCGGTFGYCMSDYYCRQENVKYCSDIEGTFYGNDITCGGNFGFCGYYVEGFYRCDFNLAYLCAGDGLLFYGENYCVGAVLPVPDPPSSSSYQTLDGCPDASTTPVNAAGVGSVSCGGETYKTVRIGEQVWMARNLNYNANGSRCYGDDTGGDSQNKCGTYGRLYDRATSMGIASDYNNKYYEPSESIMYQGVCPQGWHIPNNAEWEKLMRYVDGSLIITDPTSQTAGRYLKASDGWYNDSGDEFAGRPGFGNGEDTYGFAALPGGIYYPNGGFTDIGKLGAWWSTRAYLFMPYQSGYIGLSNSDNLAPYKGYDLVSVRCVNDNSLPLGSSSSSRRSSSSIAPSSSSIQSNIVYGPSVEYEGETYKTVVIGSQTWFQRSLNYAVSGSKCGGTDGTLKDENTVNCDKYGRLYNWNTAMSVCPSGWHLPSDEEVDKLLRYVDGTSGTSSPYESETAGRYLKASDGWGQYNWGNGEDTYGFAALPGGCNYMNTDDSFLYAGEIGCWWSASDYGYGGIASYWEFDVGESIYWGTYGKNRFFSVRCIKN